MKNIKILFIADEPSPALWDYFDASRLDGIDLIVSCGDLPPQYLSFLVTFSAGRYCMFMAIMTIAMRILPRRGAFALMTGYMNLRESALPVLEVP